MKRTAGRLVAIVLALSLVAAACGDDDDDDGAGANGGNGDGGAPSGDPYVLGVMTDLGGPFATFGAPLAAGFRTCVNEINSEGGVNGRELRASVKDDRSDVQTGQALWRDLVDEDVLGAFGITASAIWSAIAPEADDVGIPQISNGGIDEYTEVGSPEPYQFKALNRADDSAGQQFAFAEDELGLEPTDLGVIHFESPAQSVWAEAVSELAEERGWNIVSGPTGVPLDTSDYSAQAAAIVNSGAEVAFVSLFVNQAPPFVQAMRDRGFDGPIVNSATGGATPEATVQQIADPAYYVPRDYMVPEAPEPNEGVEALVAAAEAAGETRNMEGIAFTNGYVECLAAVEALRSCDDPCDSAAFRDALEDIGELDTNGLAGPSTGFTAEDHNLVKEVMFFVYSEDEGYGVPASDWMSGR